MSSSIICWKRLRWSSFIIDEASSRMSDGVSRWESLNATSRPIDPVDRRDAGLDVNVRGPFPRRRVSGCRPAKGMRISLSFPAAPGALVGCGPLLGIGGFDGLREDALGLHDLGGDLGADVGVVAQELLGVLPPLADPGFPVREPRPGLVDDVEVDAEVDKLTDLRDPLAVQEVEFTTRGTAGATLFLTTLTRVRPPTDVRAVLDGRRSAGCPAAATSRTSRRCRPRSSRGSRT